MAESPHYKEILLILEEVGVEYLIVGGYAVMKFTEPRFTKDLDVWIGNSVENSRKVYKALAEFGVPLVADGLTPETFEQDDVAYQIGVAPVRINLSTHMDGVTFSSAWERRIRASLFGVSVNFISLPDLITNKHATGRGIDLQDAQGLERELHKRQSPG